MPARPYISFIDWLKAVGMLVILYGHVAAWAPLAVIPPINTKQLGVAFFLFITGYSLARETRDRWHVAFNRLFEIFLFGAALAVLLSVIAYISQGRLMLSNYAPLLGGVNVIFNFFPANPTTWYLGTYFHIILLWALVAYRVRVTLPLLAVSFVAEVLVRVALIAGAGSLVAYMALTNWATVLLLGTWYGQRRQEAAHSSRSNIQAVVLLAVLLAGWLAIAWRLPFDQNFPFMRLMTGRSAASLLMTSTLVSALYAGATWLAFLSVDAIGVPRVVRFVAKNTLIIFLGHMPVYYALGPLLATFIPSRGVRSAILMVVCVAGLGIVSEGVRKVVKPAQLRERVYARLQAIGYP